MSKACSHCRTVVSYDAPYCDACGCQFSQTPAIKIGDTRVVQILAVAIVASLVAILVWLARR